MSKYIPERTCVACRKKADKNELLKIVKTSDGVIIDESGKADGRGAYVCKNESCIRKAIKTKAFNKSFKCNLDSSFYQILENYIHNI